MKKQILIAFLAILILTVVLFAFFLKKNENSILRVYGNIDIRQVSLSFEFGGRLTEVLFEEGDTVKKGDVLAKIDTRELATRISQARATLKVKEDIFFKLKNGNRPEEIAQAKALAESADATFRQANKTYSRCIYKKNGKRRQLVIGKKTSRWIYLCFL